VTLSTGRVPNLGPARLRYILGHNIVNEVYYPRIDNPRCRDSDLIIADDAGFWVELKRPPDYRLEM
jgi:glucoamylase